MNQTVVITGTNRGIGLELARYYKNQGYQVFALCRNASPALNDLDVNVISGIDVADDNAINNLREHLADIKIDILINNAGILQNEVLGKIDYNSIEQQFRVNTLAPLKITETLAPQLNSPAKVAFITSSMGSIADNTSGGRYGYRMSKAALNIAGVSIAHDLRSRDVAVAILHPGLVGTDMIGGYGDITPEQAAKRLAQRIEELNLENSGTFWHSNGEVLPW